MSNHHKRNVERARRFLWDADADTSTQARSRGFSTREYIVDQSVNLMDLAEDPPFQSIPLDSATTTTTTTTTTGGILSGLWASMEVDNLNRFDEYGDADPMADGDEYINNHQQKRRRFVWRKFRSILCSGKGLVLLLGCLSVFLVLTSLVQTVDELEEENEDDRFRKIRTRINEVTTLKPKSPQSLALQWLVFDDPAQLRHDHPALLDRYGLAVFYYSSHNVGGWNQSDHWMTEKGICLWHGVECLPREQTATPQNDYTPFTTIYDDNARVTRIRLRDNAMEGKIPEEFLGLDELLTLDLSNNQLSNVLPSVLGKLPKLKNLLVHGNSLVGSLPEEYGLLKDLHQLNLANNLFEGSIPKSWCTNLTQLRQLSVARNMLTGSFPDLSKMTRMNGLFLEDNDFEGRLPEWIGSLTRLLDLSMGQNRLEGPIGALSSLRNLETLSLDHNGFTGSIPNMFDHLFRLRELVMQDNGFIGSIPLTLTHLQTLKILDLSSNQLGGPIPPGLGLLTDVVTIALSHNQFEGSIPTLLGRLDDILDLSLDHNGFLGTIPTELGDCFRLQQLHLQDNLLEGTVPTQLGELTGLTSLKLESNQVQSTIPPQICALKDEDLEILTVDDAVTCNCCTNNNNS